MEHAIPGDEWSQEELLEAEGILAGAQWPNLENIYHHVQEGAFEKFDEQMLLKKARVLQLALQLAKRDGRFSMLQEKLKKGKKGMESTIKADYHGDGNNFKYYEKTAGDMVQSYWCKRHLEHMGQCFQANPVQCNIAKWLYLPVCVLETEIGLRVWGWNTHALADFQEMVTLYLPAKLVNLYLNVCTGYFLCVVVKGDPSMLCHLRCDRGLLCCWKKVNAYYGRY